MAQVDLGSRQNRHQPLRDLTRMSSAPCCRRWPAASPAVPPRGRDLEPDVLELGQPTYLHAVATESGLRLDEHLTGLVERPPLAEVLDRDPVS